VIASRTPLKFKPAEQYQQSTELTQTGEKFAGSVSIRCEGDGVIKVSFPNQQTVNCTLAM
jgi:hypothetical protein